MEQQGATAAAGPPVAQLGGGVALPSSAAPHVVVGGGGGGGGAGGRKKSMAEVGLTIGQSQEDEQEATRKGHRKSSRLETIGVSESVGVGVVVPEGQASLAAC